MIEHEDLRAAVGSGLLNEKQAAGLISLSHSRKGARENLARGDEPFELFKGFNEVFIVIGLLILAFGWWSVVTLILIDESPNLRGVLDVGVVVSGRFLDLVVHRRPRAAKRLRLDRCCPRHEESRGDHHREPGSAWKR